MSPSSIDITKLRPDERECDIVTEKDETRALVCYLQDDGSQFLILPSSWSNAAQLLRLATCQKLLGLSRRWKCLKSQAVPILSLKHYIGQKQRENLMRKRKYSILKKILPNPCLIIGKINTVHGSRDTSTACTLDMSGTSIIRPTTSTCFWSVI